MELEDAVDLVRAWRDTLADDLVSGERKYGGKPSVRETIEALDVVLDRVTRNWE